MSELNVYQRIAKVMESVDYIKKDSTVGDGRNSYKGISHDGVIAMVREHCMTNGVLIIPTQREKGSSIAGETKSGTAKIRFEAIYDVAFVNIDKPEDRHIVSVEGHGEDYNDKAPGKAISYATKTAILKAFMIETGENDEKRIDEGGNNNQSNNQNSNQSNDSPAPDKGKARAWLDKDIPIIQTIFNADELEAKHTTIKESIQNLYVAGFKDMQKEILKAISDQKKKIQERNEQNK